MSDHSRWYMAERGKARHPGDDAPPHADSIRIVDCGDPDCHCAHILLIDETNDIGIAQATINLDMVLKMYAVIARKGLAGD